MTDPKTRGIKPDPKWVGDDDDPIKSAEKIDKANATLCQFIIDMRFVI